MLIPLSWLKEYVDIKMPVEKLAERMSELGLTIETWKKIDNDIIFDPEVTPNRPDWLSVYGVAREIAAVTNSKLRAYSSNVVRSSKRSSRPLVADSNNNLPIKIIPNYKIVPRITSVIIKNVTVKPSPPWLSKRITQIGLRPINNLVDITNYVLWLYGGLLHVFDYDQIHGQQMTITQATGGEDFRSLDGIDYKLPKGAVIIKDANRIIDLLPLKGGENSAASSQTKNVLLHSVVVDPVLTRRTSQFLGLRSDSSAICERGLDANSTIIALETALQLILELAGGEIASEIIDHKEKEFKPWVVSLSHERLEKVLGIKIESKKVMDIFERLELKTLVRHSGERSDSRIDSRQARMTTYAVTVPTFRNDLHIEEDLIEEIGRIYGYNNFPKTLPATAIPTATVAYNRDYDLEYEVKQILSGFGFNEIYTYSLISENQLTKLGIDSQKTLRIDNSISRDFEYLRPHLIGNLLEALKNNLPNFQDVRLFELGKTYQGESLDKIDESYRLGLVQTGEKFYEVKGVLESLCQKLGVVINFLPPEKNAYTTWFHPGKVAVIISGNQKLGIMGEVHPKILSNFDIKSKAVIAVLKYDFIEKLVKKTKKYVPIPRYPAVIEDLSLIIQDKVEVGKIIQAIKEIDNLIIEVSLLDSYETTQTFRLTYQSVNKTLTSEEVGKIREKVLKILKSKFNAILKEL